MTPARTTDEATEEILPVPAGRSIRDAFELAWQDALKGGPLPILEKHLSAVGPEAASLRQQLLDLDQVYVRLLAVRRNAAQSDVTATDNDNQNDSPDLSGQTIDSAPDLEPIPPPTAESSMTVSIAGDSAASEDEEPVDNRPETLAAAQAGAPPGYEIHGVLGRGGMGVVYDARQVALKRRVALKMVTAGAHAGPTQRARFQIEAEAVAALQHPNIVQIYEVGEHNGIPYFSLEFVGGGTLLRKVKHRPVPGREAAALLVALGAAMHYAHQLGIVHRDLKLANVLMSNDGVPKITDFGLAKRTDSVESSQTQAGTILGTPSYMAPEQAQGDVQEVGALADVYSLGAVLYHLLTGRPPFQGTTLLETLEQVRTQEPVPVRQLQPKVARDLETICLKCLQKSPAKRYGSAGELADDLTRYLTDMPILARPVDQAERLWRWCRRNPGIASLTATVAALLIGATGVSTWMAHQINQEKKLAQKERQDAVEARDFARVSELAAKEAERKADKNALTATEQGRLAVNTLYGVVTKVQRQMREEKVSQKLRQDLLTDAFAGLEKVISSAEDSPLLRRTAAAAHQHMGDIARDLGRIEQASRHYQQCQTIIEAMTADDPDNPITKYNQAIVYEKLGDINHQLRADGAGALDYYRKCLAIRQDLAQGPPPTDAEFTSVEEKIKRPLVSSHRKLGSLFMMLGDPAEAWNHYQKAHELDIGHTFATPRAALAVVASAGPTASAAASSVAASAAAGPDMVGAAVGPGAAIAAASLGTSRQFPPILALTLGDLALQLNDVQTARGWYERVLRQSRVQIQRDANSTEGNQNLAAALTHIGDLEMRTGAAAKAREHYTQAHGYYVKQVALNADAARAQKDLSMSHYRLGTAHRRQGETEAADRHFRECLALRETLAKQDASNAYYQIDVMIALARCGRTTDAANLADKLRARAPHDPAMLFNAACTYALCSQPVGGRPPEAKYINLAVETLASAVDCGYRDIMGLQTDPDLDPIRDLPGFKDLIGKLPTRGKSTQADGQPDR